MVKKEISEKERELFKEMLLKPITELKAEKASLEEKKEKMNIEKQMVLEDLIAFKNSL
jgi:predicted transcriptional regulator